MKRVHRATTTAVGLVGNVDTTAAMDLDINGARAAETITDLVGVMGTDPVGAAIAKMMAMGRAGGDAGQWAVAAGWAAA